MPGWANITVYLVFLSVVVSVCQIVMYAATSRKLHDHVNTINKLINRTPKRHQPPTTREENINTFPSEGFRAEQTEQTTN